jgi:hypothetical protein
MIPREPKYARERAKELIAYYDSKHEKDGYTYNRLAGIAHQAYLKHRHILLDKETYKLLEENMRQKAMNELLHEEPRKLIKV